MKRKILIAGAAVLALAACSKGRDPAAVKTDPALAATVQSEAVAASGPAGEPTPPSEASSDLAEKTIPAALRGRWGLVAADCTSIRGDAKGLMTIGADSLRYYESVAKLSKVTERSATSLAAGFAFSGEGMEWQRDMTLKLQDGGKALVKQEFGADAVPGPLTYRHCS